MSFKIILNQDSLETPYGVIKRGEVLETVMYDGLDEAVEYTKLKYQLDGISVRLVDMTNLGRNTSLRGR